MSKNVFLSGHPTKNSTKIFRQSKDDCLVIFCLVIPAPTVLNALI